MQASAERTINAVYSMDTRKRLDNYLHFTNITRCTTDMKYVYLVLRHYTEEM